eukprot:5694737-Pyramimonas_sp.AAC.1
MRKTRAGQEPASGEPACLRRNCWGSRCTPTPSTKLPFSVRRPCSRKPCPLEHDAVTVWHRPAHALVQVAVRIHIDDADLEDLVAT